MDVQDARDGESLFLEVERSVAATASDMEHREGGLAAMILGTTEEWAAWQSRWKEQVEHLEERRERLRQAGRRAEETTTEMEADLQRVEEALRGWMERARALQNTDSQFSVLGSPFSV